jgi:hypothetical protein
MRPRVRSELRVEIAYWRRGRRAGGVAGADQEVVGRTLGHHLGRWEHARSIGAHEVADPRSSWSHGAEGHTLTPTTPGRAVIDIAVASSESYELWLDGSFGRGFDVSAAGRYVGRFKDKLSGFSGYVHLAEVFLHAGIHTFALSHPHAELTPGGGEGEFTSLSAITLQPQSPPSELIEVAQRKAQRLCGGALDRIELVTSA